MCQDAKPSRIRVMIVDDHVVVRDSIRLSLNAFQTIQIVAAAESGEQALQLCRTLQPDVVLMDLAMPDMDGVTAAREIMRLYPHTKIITLNGSENPRVVQQALQAGAVMCLSKNVAIDTLASAIQFWQARSDMQDSHG